MEPHPLYDMYRMPAVEKMPGAIGCRRYQCVAGPGKFAVLYEFISAEARLENYEKPVESHSRDADHPWKVADYTIHTPWSPGVGVAVTLP